MNLAGDTFHFPNSQYQFPYTCRLLASHAFVQVEAYITDEGINQADVPALITVLETAFRDPDDIATAECKLEALKQINCDFSTYYAKFQPYATDVQGSDPAKCTAMIRGLNNAINDTLALSHSITWQFHKFVAFL
jgi:hypothetical protein